MESKLITLFDYLKCLCEADIDRIIQFVQGILSADQSLPDRPDCPYCSDHHIIKYGHKGGKQRFLCKSCGQTFMHTTNTIMAHSHQSRSVWVDFIRDTIDGISLDESSENLGMSHPTAFNMRHKILAALEVWLNDHPTVLSDVAELDETFVLESYKGKKLPESVNRAPRKHGAKASKPGISSEYVAICTGIQRDGGVISKTVNRAKPSSDEIAEIYNGHIADGTLILVDGLRSYNSLKEIANCSIKDVVNDDENDPVFNLNTVNGLHSFIKNTYNQYRGVATKYLNRYNALFSVAFRCAKNSAETMMKSIGNVGRTSYWRSCESIRTEGLLCI